MNENGTLEASEIERQAGALDTQKERCYSIYNANIKRLYNISKIVRSEDSNLASTVERYANSYIRIQANMKQSFTSLANKMRDYVYQTVQNETQASDEIETLNTSINEIEEAIGGGYTGADLGSER
ncbi:MAG TPA: hypothetical protein OIM63_05910 [Bacilli bacterium]|nr:hypothetical protein [Bacilli bacterium]